MGKTHKLIKDLSNTINDVKASIDNFGLPLTNGDVYGKKELITSLEQNTSYNYPGTKKRTKNSEYQLYWLMIMISTHYQNLFKLNTGDLNLKTMWSIALQCAWFNGSVGFYFKPSELPGIGKIIPMFLSKPEINDSGEIYKATGLPAVLTINSNAMTDGVSNSFLKKHKHSMINLNAMNCVFMKWNTNMLSAWIMWKPFLMEQQYLRNHMKNSYIMGSTTTMLKAMDTSSRNVADTIETLLDSDVPVKVLADVGGKNPFPAQLETLDVKSGAGSGIMNSLAYLNAYDEFWYERLGYRHNVNDKKERNVSTEIEYSQNEFSTKEHEHLQYIEIALQQLKNKEWISENVEIELNEIEKSGTIANNSMENSNNNTNSNNTNNSNNGNNR